MKKIRRELTNLVSAFSSKGYDVELVGRTSGGGHQQVRVGGRRIPVSSTPSCMYWANRVRQDITRVLREQGQLRE